MSVSENGRFIPHAMPYPSKTNSASYPSYVPETTHSLILICQGIKVTAAKGHSSLSVPQFVSASTYSPNSAIELNTNSTLSRNALTAILVILAETHSNSMRSSDCSTESVRRTWSSLSSLSGDRIWSACEASNGVGNGIDNDLDVRSCDVRIGKEYALCGRVSIDVVIVAQGSAARIVARTFKARSEMACGRHKIKTSCATLRTINTMSFIQQHRL
jgi:hypothetical protein